MPEFFPNYFWAVFSAVVGFGISVIYNRSKKRKKYVSFTTSSEEYDPHKHKIDSRAIGYRDVKVTNILLLYHGEEKLTKDDISKNDLLRFIGGRMLNLKTINEKSRNNPNGFRLEKRKKETIIRFQYWLKGDVLFLNLIHEGEIQLHGTIIEGEVISNKALQGRYRKQIGFALGFQPLLILILLMADGLGTSRDVIMAIAPGLMVILGYTVVKYEKLLQMLKIKAVLPE